MSLSSVTQLGLRANWRQFSLLVAINAFVGAMVGIERAILPLLAEREFGLASRAAALSFIVSFGFAKALTNLAAGRLADRLGRKRLLLAGWFIGLPVPFLLLLSESWAGVVAANALLGIQQGLCWSLTVIMKIDLAGPRRRGLAMGLNEAAGYGAVAVAAFASGPLAGVYGARNVLFAGGLVCAIAGLLLSAAFVRDTTSHAILEARDLETETKPAGPESSRAGADGHARRRFACNQAGLVNNLNDGVAWGLFPIMFAERGLALDSIAALAALYPAVWAVAQLATGALSDRYGRRGFIAGGMLMQAAGLWIVAAASGMAAWSLGQLLLGFGTAMVYPTLLAAVSDASHPSRRASAVGVYRLWRDLGYAVGGLAAGILADALGIRSAIVAVGWLTAVSGAIVWQRMRREYSPESFAPES